MSQSTRFFIAVDLSAKRYTIAPLSSRESFDLGDQASVLSESTPDVRGSMEVVLNHARTNHIEHFGLEVVTAEIRR